MLSAATRELRDHAAAELDSFAAEYGPPDDPEAAIDRWMRRLISVGDVPDKILEAMPEVSRHNDPQVSPQQYECGCVAMTRITDRDCRTWLGCDEKPFELRLALPCDGGPACELLHLRTGERQC